MICGLAALVALAPPVRADTNPTSPGSSSPADSGSHNATFGIGPASSSAPDGRPYLNYVVTAGAAMSDNVAVSNLALEPLTVDLYATDTFNRDDGSADLLPAGDKPSDAGQWLTLATPDGSSKVTIAPRSTVIVPVQLQVPASAAAGDHEAGIVASVTSDAHTSTGDVVHVDQRVAVRAFIRVAGTLTPELTVEGVRTVFQENANPLGTGTLSLTYTVRNRGNIKLGAQQHADIQGLLGTTKTAAALPDIPMLLPGASVTTTTVIHGVPPELLGTVHVAVTPRAIEGDVDPRLDRVGSSKRQWTLPLTLLVCIALILLIDRYRRRRAKRVGAAPPKPAPTSPKTSQGKELARSASAAVVLLLATVALARPAVAAPVAFDATPKVPYNDPAADGGIGLCNRQGQPIDHGNIHDAPFVWTALGANAAPSPYDTDGSTATLFAYQPRQGVSPGEWSGDLLTASARYTNPKHPTAQSVDGDVALADFLGSYPPSWDGFIQLRLYLGTEGQPARTSHYAAADIRVDGDNWTVVRGANVPCDAGSAVSMAAILIPSTTAPPASTPAPAPASVPASTPAAEAAPAAAAPAVPIAVHDAAGHRRGLPPIALATAAAGATAGILVLRRRHRSSKRGPATAGAR